jgi:hypothetical protein
MSASLDSADFTSTAMLSAMLKNHIGGDPGQTGRFLNQSSSFYFLFSIFTVCACRAFGLIPSRGRPKPNISQLFRATSLFCFLNPGDDGTFPVLNPVL